MIPPFDQIPIEYLLPQRPPFVFVDHLLHHEEECTRTSFRIPEQGIFVENGRLATGGLVEQMAQSSAARVGYIARTLCEVHEFVNLCIGVTTANHSHIPNVPIVHADE